MRRVLDVLGPWAWFAGCGAAGVFLMLVVLNLTAVRSVDALPVLPTREPTETALPPRSLEITLSHSDSGDVVVSAAPVAEGPPSSVGETPTPVQLAVRRDGDLTTITVRPEYEAALGHTRIGFGYGHAAAEYGVGEATGEALGAMWKVTSGTATVFANLLDEKRRKEVSGVVGVSDVAHETIDKFGATQALILLALVSLSLGLINLFPFLPLDGGHIFWSLVEKVRGKPGAFRTMERAGAVGFVLVIMLAFLGLSNDIGRITGEGFNVR